MPNRSLPLVPIELFYICRMDDAKPMVSKPRIRPRWRNRSETVSISICKVNLRLLAVQAQ